jgi:hypothetical protein
MPVALERKLKRQVAHKKISKERKDAYVYGTLRKTGWKPKREMNAMEDRVVRLSEISKNLDRVIQFQYDDDDDDRKKNNTLRNTAIGAGLLGAGGTAAYAASPAVRGVVNRGYQAAAPIVSQTARTIGGGIKSAAGAVTPALTGAAQAAGGALKGGLKTGLRSSGAVLRRISMMFQEGPSRIDRLIQLNQDLNSVIELAKPELVDPGAGFFGGSDPGIMRQVKKYNAQDSAVQRLRLKIASLRGMGLHS